MLGERRREGILQGDYGGFYLKRFLVDTACPAAELGGYVTSCAQLIDAVQFTGLHSVMLLCHHDALEGIAVKSAIA